jgi:Asp-tRNA(Asn)/Glu-tRNA(Gln) amidotransferase A subunit family amidase
MRDMNHHESNGSAPDRERRTLLVGLSATLPAMAIAPMSGCATAASSISARPEASTDLTELGATDAVRMIRNGELSAESYVGRLLAQQERLKSLNTVTWVDRDRALQAGRAVDQARAQGKPLGPIAGLPLIVKDNIDTVGFPTSAGTPSLKNHRPKADAPVMQRLYAQGALLLAKANMHELAIGGTSSNAAFGPVRNPYDPRRIPGGSSGGTAAALAARIAPAGLGTDTAGSVRIPAAFSGISALRPTTAGGRGAYSVEGVVPLVLELDTIGPMARTVADVALLDSAITGRAVPQPAALRGLRIGIARGAYWEDLESAVADTLASAMARLRDAGVTFVDIDMRSLSQRALDLYNTIYLAGFGRDLGTWLGANAPGLSLQQLVQQIASRDVQGRFNPAPTPTSAEALVKARGETLPQLLREYEAVFRSNGVVALAYPTEPIVAPLILEDGDRGEATIELNGRQVNRSLQLIRNTRQTGGLGLPGVAVPAGLSAQGLPVGLELDGLPRSDAALLGVGMALERALGPLPGPRLVG